MRRITIQEMMVHYARQKAAPSASLVMAEGAELPIRLKAVADIERFTEIARPSVFGRFPSTFAIKGVVNAWPHKTSATIVRARGTSVFVDERGMFSFTTGREATISSVGIALEAIAGVRQSSVRDVSAYVATLRAEFETLDGDDVPFVVDVDLPDAAFCVDGWTSVADIEARLRDIGKEMRLPVRSFGAHVVRYLERDDELVRDVASLDGVEVDEICDALDVR